MSLQPLVWVMVYKEEKNPKREWAPDNVRAVPT